MTDNTNRALTASLMLKQEMGEELNEQEALYILCWPLKNYSKPFLAVRKLKEEVEE